MDSDNALIKHLCMPVEWTQSIPFMVIPDEEMGKNDEPEPELLDVMGISDITYKGPYRYYFPRKYKPSDPRGHQLLTDDLRASGLSQGVQLARAPGLARSQPLVQYSVSVLGGEVHVGSCTNDVSASVVFIEGSNMLYFWAFGECRVEDHRCRDTDLCTITGASCEAKGVVGELIRHRMGRMDHP